MKLLIATHNVAKVDEYKKYLKYLSAVEVVSLSDIGIKDEIEESGRTFKENALLKAEFYAAKTGLITIGDDSGLEIHALDNKPGVLSRRWLGYEASDQELIDYTLENMKGIVGAQRSAQMTTGLVLYDPISKLYEYFEDSTKGFIVPKKADEYIQGFPFRALLWIPEYNKLWQDLTESEQEEVNCRKRLCTTLIRFLQESY